MKKIYINTKSFVKSSISVLSLGLVLISGGCFNLDEKVYNEVTQSTFTATQKDVIALVAGFGELGELFHGNQQGKRFSFGGLFQAHRNEPVEVGGRETDPAIGGSFDLEGLDDGEGRFVDDDFAQSGESGFELGNGQGDGLGVHGWVLLVWGENEKPMLREGDMGRWGDSGCSYCSGFHLSWSTVHSSGEMSSLAPRYTGW